MIRNWHSIVPAAFVIFERDGKVLLLRRANTGYRDGWYSLPAGHVELHEMATAAAIREASEEVAVKLRPEDLEIVHIGHRVSEEGDHDRVDFYFRTRHWDQEPANNEPEKCDDLSWFSYDDLPEKLIPSVRQVLLDVREGVMYSEVA